MENIIFNLNPEIISWKGKLLKDMTKEELMKALIQAYQMLETERREKTKLRKKFSLPNP